MIERDDGDSSNGIALTSDMQYSHFKSTFYVTDWPALVTDRRATTSNTPTEDESSIQIVLLVTGAKVEDTSIETEELSFITLYGKAGRWLMSLFDQ
jgi:hypothetical protein